MNRSTLLLAACLACTSVAHAALTGPGQLAFTAFNADEDGFAIVALTPIGPGTQVYFTDNEWPGGAPGSAAFSTGESALRWVTGDAAVAAGTVVRFSAIDQPQRAASIGSLSALETASLGFAATGDTLFAYGGVTHRVPGVFYAAISSEGFAGSSLAGTGLAVGQSAVAITAGADFGEYTGPRSGRTAFADYAPLVNDAARWTAFATGNFAATVPDTSAFGVSPVPEPQTWALLATGLGLVGLRLSGRARRDGALGLVPVSGPSCVLRAAPSVRAGR